MQKKERLKLFWKQKKEKGDDCSETRQTHSELPPKSAGEWRLHMQIRLIRPVSEWMPSVLGHCSVETISQEQAGGSLRPEKVRGILVNWKLGRRAATIDDMERKIDDRHQSLSHCGTIICRLASRMRNVVEVQVASRPTSISTSRPHFYEVSWMSERTTVC